MAPPLIRGRDMRLDDVRNAHRRLQGAALKS
jgi:hypothetical protein